MNGGRKIIHLSTWKISLDDDICKQEAQLIISTFAQKRSSQISAAICKGSVHKT
jgi:hypothetical protein